MSLKSKQSLAVVAHTLNPSTRESQAFNPSTREIETGRDIARKREEYKARGERNSRHSEDSV